jgi:hypothetical protein
MTVESLIDALSLPPETSVDKPIPKSALLEEAEPTAADRRQISNGIEDIRWVAALKPENCGVPAFRDDRRAYEEVHVVSTTVREGEKDQRIIELLHRSIPYPIFLLHQLHDSWGFSLSHKRHSDAGGGAVVLESPIAAEADPILRVDWNTKRDQPASDLFAEQVSISQQSREDMYSLYSSWMDTATGLLAARITGEVKSAPDPETAVERLRAVQRMASIEDEIERIRSQAAKENQMPRKIELNTRASKLREEGDALRAKL